MAAGVGKYHGTTAGLKKKNVELQWDGSSMCSNPTDAEMHNFSWWLFGYCMLTRKLDTELCITFIRLFLLTLPYLWGRWFQTPSAEAITGLAQCASLKQPQGRVNDFEALTNLISRAHSFPRAAEFSAVPRNLSISLKFCGIVCSLVINHGRN